MGPMGFAITWNSREAGALVWRSMSDWVSVLVQNLLRRERIDYANHAVARHQCCQLFFAHALGSAGAQRQDQIAHVRGAVVHPDLDVVRKLLPALAHDSQRSVPPER